MGVKTLSEVCDEAFRARGVEPVHIQAQNRHMSVACDRKRRLGAVKRVCVRLLKRLMHDMEGGEANGRRNGLMGCHDSSHEVRCEAMREVLDEVWESDDYVCDQRRHHE